MHALKGRYHRAITAWAITGTLLSPTLDDAVTKSSTTLLTIHTIYSSLAMCNRQQNIITSHFKKKKKRAKNQTVSHFQLPDNSGGYRRWVIIWNVHKLIEKGDNKFQTLFRGDDREGENQSVTQNSRRQFTMIDTIYCRDSLSPSRRRRKGAPASSISSASADIFQTTAHCSMQFTAG